MVKVKFGDSNMEIKRDDPERRKNFRARHNCSDKKNKWSAGYWSCKFWSSSKTVSELLSETDEKDENPCWDGYEMIGMKTKNGKEVPNCVPKNKKNNESVNESREDNTYMFWQNLYTIKHAVEEMLKMDKASINDILANGHGWVLDKIATSKDDIEESYHFIEDGNKSDNEEIDI